MIPFWLICLFIAVSVWERSIKLSHSIQHIDFTLSYSSIVWPLGFTNRCSFNCGPFIKIFYSFDTPTPIPLPPLLPLPPTFPQPTHPPMNSSEKVRPFIIGNQQSLAR